MDNYLVHHGVKGQKWGVRNGPPYPIDAVRATPTEFAKAYVDWAKKTDNKWYKDFPEDYARTVSEYTTLAAKKGTPKERAEAAAKAIKKAADDWNTNYSKPGWKKYDPNDPNLMEQWLGMRSATETTVNRLTDYYTRHPSDMYDESSSLYSEARKQEDSALSKSRDGREARLASTLDNLAKKFKHSDLYDVESLSHSGILGQKWGHRNGPPYPLGQDQKTKEEKRLERADKRFVKKNDKKIRRYAEKATKSQMREADKTLRTLYKTKTTRGKVARNYATAYNKILADLMNTAIGDIETPSGRVVKFVAKRGEIGVYTALADRGYDLSQLKNGVYDSGKVAYRKEEVSKMNIDD